jgi:hypothetical protein
MSDALIFWLAKILVEVGAWFAGMLLFGLFFWLLVLLLGGRFK